MLNHSASPILLLLWSLCWLILIGQYLELRWHSASRRPAQTAPRSNLPPLHEPDPCPACERQGAESGQPPTPRVPPPALSRLRGRPCEVNLSSHYCPNRECDYFGWIGLGNLCSNGHPNGGGWRQLACVVCHQTFMETTHTIFYAKKAAAETIWRVLAALAEGLDIRATARVFELDPNTVQRWLRQAAEHMQAVSHYLIHDLHLSQVQVDELWALLGRRDEAGPQQSKGRAKRWVWVAIDPVSKLLLAYVIGNRSQDCAQLLIHAVVSLLAPGCLPLFLSDQWSAYAEALLTHFGQWVAVARRSPRGRLPKPRWEALPGLRYAQLVKERVKGRVVRVSFRVVYGTLEQVQAILQASLGRVINTAFIERVNLTLRQHVAALARKVIALAKTEAGLNDQMSLSSAYYNFCLPHASLRLPLPELQATLGSGSPKQWQARTPAMAAGVTNRLWSLPDLLRWRVPPWPQTMPATA